MTSLLLPSSVALLAHKRLVDVVEALERKLGATVYDTGLDVTGRNVFEVSRVEARDAERRVLALARAAKDMLEAGPKAEAPLRLTGAQGVGRYTVLGAAGFELPSYVEVFAQNPGWRSDAMRRGTPDPNLSKVVVGTTQFAIRAGQLALAAATGDEDRQRIRSFTMGLLSGIATSVIADPVLRGLQARRTRRDWNRHLPAADISAAEARVLRSLLGGPTGAGIWQSWWPPVKDVPDALFKGYAGALEEAYFLAGQRPEGFAEFELGFEPGEALTPERLRDAYTLLRLDAAVTTWRWPAWFGVLSPVVLMPPIGLAIGRKLSHSGAFFDDDASADGRSVHQLLSLGFGLGGIAPFVYSMILWSQIPEHTEAFVNALLLGLLRVVLVPANLAAAAKDADEAVLWVLLTLLAGEDVYALVRAIRAKVRNRPGGFVFFLQTLPAITAVLTLLYAELMQLAGVDSDGAFWGVVAGIAVLHLIFAGILAAKLAHSGGFRSLFLPDPFPLTDGLRQLAQGLDPAALAHLFDDSMLWHLPAAATPTLSDLRYPAGPRAVVRLWWTGAGNLQVSHGGRTVTFKRDDGTTVPVVLPPGKTGARDLATLLKSAVAGLEAEVFHASDPANDLPYPHALSDPGDERPTLADHDAHAGDFIPLGKTPETAYLLRHAPRVALATTYGAGGPSRSQPDGLELVPGEMLGDLEESALGLAADLAALLCMGAAPSLSGGTVPVANRPGRPNLPALGPVYQVFRQWNLDERRVNEWRMLVAGGAESEKGGDRLHADPAMRPLEQGAAAPYASPAEAGERLATAMGWIPLWRAWTRVAGDVTADTASAGAMPYTPQVALGGTAPSPPSNADLTTALRFLLDLPA